MEIFNISVNQTIDHYFISKKSLKDLDFKNLFDSIPIQLKIPIYIEKLILNSNSILSILFYYYIHNYLQLKLNIINLNENFIINLYFLFTMILEKENTCTLYELKNEEDMEYVDTLFMYVEEIYNLLSNEPTLINNRCGEVCLENLTKIQQIVSQKGGGRNEFSRLNELLQLVLEPRHDFGKNRVEDINIRKKFYKTYKGEIDNINFDKIKGDIHTLLNMYPNEFLIKERITIDHLLNSENFEPNFFCFFHNNINYSNYSENVTPQLFKYVKFKKSFQMTDTLYISSVYDLLNKSKMFEKMISIEAFQQSILLANNINYYMLDMSPDRETQLVYSTRPITEITSAATLWDPNSKTTISPVLDRTKPEERNLYIALHDTYLTFGRQNRANYFPKRENIQSGRFQLRWGVTYEPLSENPIEFRLNIEVNINEQDKPLFPNSLKCRINVPGLSVTELGKLMSYIENYPKNVKIEFKDNTNIVLQSIIYPILTKIDSKNVKNIKNVLFALLLDFKVSGDYGESNWISIYNDDNIQNKCMLVTGDKLCALESILIGNPTLINNNSPDDEDSIPILTTIKNFVEKTKKIYLKYKKKILPKVEVVGKEVEPKEVEPKEVEPKEGESEEGERYEGEPAGEAEGEPEEQAEELTSKQAVESMQKIINNFNFVFFQGKTQGYNNNYIRSVLSNCYTKLYDICDFDSSKLELEAFQLLSNEYYKRFNISRLLDLRHNNEIINKFNEDGEFLIAHILPDDSSSSQYEIVDLFKRVYNMDTFCNLFVEINKYMDQIGNIQEFIIESFDICVAIWLMLENSSFIDFESTLDFVKNKGQVQSKETSRVTERKNQSYTKIIDNIAKHDNCVFSNTFRGSFINSRLHAEYRKAIKLLYKSVLIYNNNNLFGTMYSNLINSSDYITNKQEMIHNLYNQLFDETKPDIEEKNPDISILNKFKGIIHLWTCLQKHYPLQLRLQNKDSEQVMLIPINLIISEMKDTLYIQARYKQELNDYIEHMNQFLQTP